MKINIKEFTGNCSCGRNHQLVVDDVILEEGALKKLPEILNKEPYDQYKHLVMVCDDNTYEAAGKEVERLLGGIPVIKLDPENLHANEIGVAKVKEQLDPIKEVDCMIAVGSGTIHDLTRYNAYERKIPFISVPTAASVDGYVSTVAAMSWYGFKKSMIAESPILVVADSRIITDAPMRLTASGVGDLLGKYTAIADWKITNILDGEYICDRICEMEYDALDKLKESLDGLSNRDINAYEELMYGLLLSGLAMQMTGHSRPASGAEHHMAHFWEMAVINDEIDAYHGEKVGVGLIQVSDIYHEAVKYLKEGNFKVKDHVDIETDLIEKTFTNKELCESIKKTNDPNLLDLIDPKELREKTEYYAKKYNFIIIMPEVQRSFYTTGKVGIDYFHYVADELPAICGKWFHLDQRRENTFIAGESMGGYGAVKIALNRPEKYEALASLSGVLDYVGFTEMVLAGNWEDMSPQEIQSFHGEAGKPEEWENPLFLVEKLAKDENRPRLIQFCGTEDFLYENNQKFRKVAESNGYGHVYMEGPGDHEWPYWDKMIQRAIQFFLNLDLQTTKLY